MRPSIGHVVAQVLLYASVTLAAITIPSFDPAPMITKSCPEACLPGEGPGDWNSFHDVASLSVCPEPVILQYHLLTPFGAPNTHITIRACTLGNHDTRKNYLADSGYVAPDASEGSVSGSLLRRGGLGNATMPACGTDAAIKSNTLAQLAWWHGGESLSTNPAEDIRAANEKLERFLQDQDPLSTCNKTIQFAYVRGVLVGLYSGSLMHDQKTSASMLPILLNHLTSSEFNSRTAIEICGRGRTASNTFGIVADPSGDFAAVQEIMRAWNDGKCSSDVKGNNTKAVGDAVVWGFTAAPTVSKRDFERLGARADCRTISVEKDELCPALAKRCGLGLIGFQSFNKGIPNFCNNLKVGQRVCCSAGTLPDITPKPDPDGTCAHYDVEPGEGCYDVAAKHGLVEDDLWEFNKETWGWDGCGNLQLKQRICVSKGRPTMPAPVKDAVCGPTVPGTQRPASGVKLTDLNPCPLDVCCNIWGNCGLTTDFCVVSKSVTGNPGTSKPGANGCVANCGMDLITNSSPAPAFKKVGYFEGWNYERACLNMHVSEVDRSYTHVHFAFGEITPDLQVVMKRNLMDQWNAFLQLTNFPKKILAFGGWAFSNDPPTSGIFRKAVAPSNRQMFADRVVKFAIDNRLDGLDFDWEYPGAYDIKGSDPGLKEDGENYYQFLKLVREKLPKEKSLSIAVASSYWYLRGFPIKKMATVLDYIVFMTYDLHGQWDSGNKWTSPGCPGGNCLRSHVNSTETHSALVMITRAGVDSHKVIVGVSSYGRSFKMSDATCTGPQCTFLGDNESSQAKKGRCTDTAGYISDFEIGEIIKNNPFIKSWHDKESDSDMLVYDATEWVAYMSKLTKQRRTLQYRNLNLGGTADWAIDLQGEGTRVAPSGGRPVYLDPSIYKSPTVKCEPPCVLVFPPSALPAPTVINPGKYTTSLEYGAMGTTIIGGRETTAFITKTTTIVVTIPPTTINSMFYSNINITVGQGTTRLQPDQSITFGPMPMGVPDGQGGTTTRTLTLPPWPAITGGSGGATNNPGSPPSSKTTTISGRPPGGDNQPTRPPPSTGLPMRTYPPYGITPIAKHIDEIQDDDEDDDAFLTPCNLWFFNLCPNGKTDKIGGLKWILPPGIYPPGPPPIRIIGPPGPGPVIKRPVPPWPPITIGRDHKPQFPGKPQCKTASASACSTTTTISTITMGPTTTTTATTVSGCDPIVGCSLTDWETRVTTRTELCSLPSPRAKARRDDENQPSKRAKCDQHLVVIPKSMERPGGIAAIIQQHKGDVKVLESKLLNPHHTFLYAVTGATDDLFDDLDDLDEVLEVYWDYPYYEPKAQGSGSSMLRNEAVSKRGTGVTDSASPLLNDLPVFNGTDAKGIMAKRGLTKWPSKYWAPSQVSLAPPEEWLEPGTLSYVKGSSEPYVYLYDDTTEEGQFIYIIGEGGIWDGHEEFADLVGTGRFTTHKPDFGYGQGRESPDQRRLSHGSVVAAMAVGKNLGVCPKCHLVFVENKNRHTHEVQLMHDLVFTLEDILKNKAHRLGKAVINMSFGSPVSDDEHFGFVRRYRDILELLETQAKAVLVTIAHNLDEPPQDFDMGEDDNGQIVHYPARFASGDKKINPYTQLHNIIVVGGTTQYGQLSRGSRYADFITTFAPGEALDGPSGPQGYTDTFEGTSFAGPMVAGLAAYFRSLPSPWQEELKEPALVKRLIQLLHRPFEVYEIDVPDRLPVIWNGQVREHSCVADWGKSQLPKQCHVLGDLLDDSPVPPWAPGGDGPSGPSIDWSPGPDSPVCLFGTCGGRLCKGYYCVPNPIGVPPDFRDPKDTNSAGVWTPPQGEPAVTGGPFPTLTQKPAPTENCVGSTAIRVCAGNGAHVGCTTTTRCTEWSEPTPTSQPKPQPTSDTMPCHELSLSFDRLFSTRAHLAITVAGKYVCNTVVDIPSDTGTIKCHAPGYGLDYDNSRASDYAEVWIRHPWRSDSQNARLPLDRMERAWCDGGKGPVECNVYYYTASTGACF